MKLVLITQLRFNGSSRFVVSLTLFLVTNWLIVCVPKPNNFLWRKILSSIINLDAKPFKLIKEESRFIFLFYHRVSVALQCRNFLQVSREKPNCAFDRSLRFLKRAKKHFFSQSLKKKWVSQCCCVLLAILRRFSSRHFIENIKIQTKTFRL